jgi:curli biogenesis system outer membrane secretion channel CsgG
MVQPKAATDTTMAEKSFSCPGKAKLAVARFDWRVGGSGSTTVRGPSGTYTVSHESGVMTGLRDMLVTSLVQTRCFNVLERQDFGALADEMALREQGYTAEKKTRKGKVKEADVMVVAAITGWEPGTSGGGGGLGGLFGNVVGGVAGAFSKTHMAMDIRLVNVDTSEVITATRVEGSASSVSAGGLIGGIVGSTPMGGGLSAYAKTPMEKAIRACINEAVTFVVNETPNEYYK